MHGLKDGICMAAGVICAAVAQAFGGWDAGITTLMIFMAIDYLTGMICAGIFHHSPKMSTH